MKMPAQSPATATPSVGPEEESFLRLSQTEQEGLRWTGIPLKHYKEEGTHFRSITRQVLFDEENGLSNEVRYFEIQPGGHSTLERHQHVHAVIILHGSGSVLVGDRLASVRPFDLVHVPPMTWHQFRADRDDRLGFLCLVPCDRDRPQRPTEEEAAALLADARISSFIRL